MDIRCLIQVPALIPPLHQDEGHAVDNQSQSHHRSGVQMGIHPVVKEHAQNTGGENGNADLEPQCPGFVLFRFVLAGGEGVQLVEEQHHHRQNGAQLDDHIEHGFEGIGGL